MGYVKDKMTGRAEPPPLTLEAAIAELKKRGKEVEIVSEEEKVRRRAELLKCAGDCAYFIKTYCKTYDPRLLDPFVPFDLFARQEDLVRWLDERLSTQTGGVVEKSRDVGVSWVICAWLLHKWLFWNGFAGGVGSRKLEYVDSKGDPKSLFEKFRMMMERLPSWMIPPLFEKKKHDLECRLLNPAIHASITGEGGTDIGRGGRTTAYLVDEYNYLEHPEMADAALRDNTNCPIYVGTPNGLKGIYEKRDTWNCFRFHWLDDPRKNVKDADGTYPWYERQKHNHRDQPWIIKQEIDIDYLGSGHPAFDRVHLVTILEKVKREKPIMEEVPGQSAWAGEVRTYKHPEQYARYLIVADVAEGESRLTNGDPDWSVAHVYDCETWEQVVTYRGRCDVHAYAVDLATLGEMYNYAEICVERTGPGIATIKTLTEEIGYPGIWGEYSPNGNIKHGWMATAKSKATAESELGSIIADMKEGFDGFIWNDPRTVEELIHYAVLPTGRTEAEPGWHDDHVSATRMAALLLPGMTTRRKMLPTKPPKPVVTYGGTAYAGRGRR